MQSISFHRFAPCVEGSYEYNGYAVDIYDYADPQEPNLVFQSILTYATPSAARAIGERFCKMLERSFA